jgi:hypothetical protein
VTKNKSYQQQQKQQQQQQQQQQFNQVGHFCREYFQILKLL